MKKKIVNLYILVASLFMALPFLSSCEDMLEEKRYDFIVPEDIEDSDKGADIWALGVYNKLSDDIFRWGNMNQALDFDNDYITGPSWSFKFVGAGSFQGSEHTGLMWEHLYTLIHRANMALEYVNKMNNTSPKHKENVVGELCFLKAYAYFVLVRAYGDVPIHYQSIYEGSDRNQPRQAIQKVYEHIIELLKEAETKMYKNTDTAFSPGRVSAGAAATLLAKVYATIGAAAMPSGKLIVKGGKPFVMNGSTKVFTDPVDLSIDKDQVAGYEAFDYKAYYTLARDKAAEVMRGDHGTYDLLDFDKLWVQESKNKVEHIWSLQTKSGDEKLGTTLSRGYTGTENDKGEIVTGLWWGCRDHWYKLFESQDLRVADGVIHRWVTESSGSNNKGYYYPNNEEWKKRAQGYTDASGNKIPAEAPFNDGKTYSSGSTYMYLAFLKKYYHVTDRKLERTDANWPFLRYADLLLLFAEAENEVNDGPTTAALDALNKVRGRSNASLKSLQGADHINDLVLFRSAVLEERAMELALEGDRRWDLIRWGIYLPVMNAIGAVDEIGTAKNREQRNLLYPIPNSEISSNKNITKNNPGWS